MLSWLMHQYLVQKPAGSRNSTELARWDLWLRTELQKDTCCKCKFWLQLCSSCCKDTCPKCFLAWTHRQGFSACPTQFVRFIIKLSSVVMLNNNKQTTKLAKPTNKQRNQNKTPLKQITLSWHVLWWTNLPSCPWTVSWEDNLTQTDTKWC